MIMKRYIFKLYANNGKIVKTITEWDCKNEDDVQTMLCGIALGASQKYKNIDVKAFEKLNDGIEIFMKKKSIRL